MIVICPACSTRFAVDTSAFGPGGRRVRCGSCRHIWLQPAPQIGDEEEPLPKLFAGEPRDIPPDPAPERPAMPRIAAEAEEPPQPPLPTSRANREPRRTGIAGLAWSLLALVVILVIGGAVVAKDNIQAAWPESVRFYAAVGLATPPQLGAGLELRKVSWKRDNSGDVSVLLIEGEVANVSKEVRPVPKIRGAILGNGGREISHWLFAAPEPKLLPGESVRFRTELRNPPDGAERLTMNFAHES